MWRKMGQNQEKKKGGVGGGGGCWWVGWGGGMDVKTRPFLWWFQKAPQILQKEPLAAVQWCLSGKTPSTKWAAITMF